MRKKDTFSLTGKKFHVLLGPDLPLHRQQATAARTWTPIVVFRLQGRLLLAKTSLSLLSATGSPACTIVVGERKATSYVYPENIFFRGQACAFCSRTDRQTDRRARGPVAPDAPRPAPPRKPAVLARALCAKTAARLLFIFF